MRKRLTVLHPVYAAAHHTKREHERFNVAVACVDPNVHHNAFRLKIVNNANAEAIAAMMAAAERNGFVFGR